MKKQISLALTLLSFLLFIYPSNINAQKKVEPLKYGKYACVASKYINGSYELTPKGYFIINRNGSYTYYGFEKPSSGKFTIDAKGDLSFKGGYFDGGKAEKIDRPNKFFIVFPSNPDNRWTAGYVDK